MSDINDVTAIGNFCAIISLLQTQRGNMHSKMTFD